MAGGRRARANAVRAASERAWWATAPRVPAQVRGWLRRAPVRGAPRPRGAPGLVPSRRAAQRPGPPRRAAQRLASPRRAWFSWGSVQGRAPPCGVRLLASPLRAQRPVRLLAHSGRFRKRAPAVCPPSGAGRSVPVSSFAPMSPPAASRSRTAARTAAIVSSNVLPSVRTWTASSAGRDGDTARPPSIASRRRRSARIACPASDAGSIPRSAARRDARVSAEASSHTLTSASGRTTVPMSRPASRIPPSRVISRWRARSAARTSGAWATAGTARSTSPVRTRDVTSTPPTMT